MYSKCVLVWMLMLVPTAYGCVRFIGYFDKTGALVGQLWDNVDLLGPSTCTSTADMAGLNSGVYTMNCEHDYSAVINVNDFKPDWKITIKHGDTNLDLPAKKGVDDDYRACQYACTEDDCKEVYSPTGVLHNYWNGLTSY
jgi:hypothetical protein